MDKNSVKQCQSQYVPDKMNLNQGLKNEMNRGKNSIRKVKYIYHLHQVILVYI
jgi:hypothetical protein